MRPSPSSPLRGIHARAVILQLSLVVGFFCTGHRKFNFHTISPLYSYWPRFSASTDLIGFFSAPRFAVATFCGTFCEFSEFSEFFSQFLTFFSPTQVFRPTMPPKNVPQPRGTKGKEQNADALGEVHKPAKKLHDLSPASKSKTSRSKLH